MKLRKDSEMPYLSHSSRIVHFSEKVNEKSNDFSKNNMDKSNLIYHNKSNKLLPSFSSKMNSNIKFNAFSSLGEGNYNKSKRIIKNNRNNNHLNLNYSYMPKENSLNKSINKSFNKIKISLPKPRNSTIIKAFNEPLYEPSPETNLKLVQKELQFKLLDMSMAMENVLNSDEDESNYFSNIKKDKKEKKVMEKYIKSEIQSYKNDIVMRKKSISVNDIKQLYNLENYYNKGFKNLNKSINKGYNKSKTNKFGFNSSNNNNSFLNITTLKSGFGSNNKRRSFNFSINNYILNRNNLSMMNGNKNSNFKNTVILSKSNFSINKGNISMNKIISNSNDNMKYENKYRLLLKQKELYDSYEDEEVVDEIEDEYFFISPETHRIFIFDIFILFSNLFCSFYYPLNIAQSICFCSYIPILIKYILFFTDFINIIDIILSFFRAYYNFEYALIKKNDKIVKHYLKIFFVPDLIAAIPIFSFSYLLCQRYNPDSDLCFTNGIDLKYNCLKLCFGLKLIKLFKVLDKKSNRGINYYYEIISESYTLEKTMSMALFFVICILGFNLFICYHIFIGRQSYPNWIIDTNNQDKDFINLYFISLYFLITTITSVGYGDITCVSFSETIFQIILLTIGVIAYSWVVSTVGNYVKNETKAAIKYNKDIELLEEIRISYPKMPFKLYNKIQKHLESVSHQQERFDTNLLVNNLPYTLKNQLMFIIYENIIKHFNFFKDCQNSDFILRILSSLIPHSAKKGTFIIHEGELIDNIIFVKQGRLSLVASIDLENPLISIDNYLGAKFEDINEKMNTKLDISMSMNNTRNNIGKRMKTAKTQITTLLKGNELMESNIEQEIGKCDFEGDDFDVGNHQFLNILDILKNEHYGEVYMFLQKPSPLSLRVKSKFSELFLLRKNEAMLVSKAYPNVWKKIYYKSYHNMKSIKKLTKKIIIQYSKSYGHKFDTEKGLDSTKHDTENILFNLGINDNEDPKKKLKFKLDGDNSNKSSNKDIPSSSQFPKKSCLKKKSEKINDTESKIANSFNIDNKNYIKKTQIIKHKNNKGFIIQINGIKTNINNTLSTIDHKENNNDFTSNKNINEDKKLNNNDESNKRNNKFSRAISAKIKRQNCTGYNSFRSNKNYKNFNNNYYKKRFSTYSKITNKDDSKITGLNNIQSSLNNEKNNNINNPFPQIYSNIAVRSNSIHFKNKESDFASNNYLPIEQMRTIKINDFNDTKIIQNTSLKNALTKKITVDSGRNFDKPRTIQNLSKPLLKKIKKKIEKRRKKKKLYKMLISKISESLIKINPNLNLNLNSSINNSYINDQKFEENNIQLGIGLQNTFIIQDNCITDDKVKITEGLNNLINQDSPDFDSDTSSQDSISSKEFKAIEKKKIEFSISENISFSYNTTYDNLNTISEGNYSKDINLRKSVMKLIGFYLNEKKNKSNNKSASNKTLYLNTNTKEKEKENSPKKLSNKKNLKFNNKKEQNKNSTTNIIPINSNKKVSDKNNTYLSPQNNNKKVKDKNIKIDLNKEQKEEKDVWAFLNEDKDENKYKFSFSLDKDKDKEINKDKINSKTNKNIIFKKTMDFSKEKSKYKNSFNLFGDKEQTELVNPKNKKKVMKSKKIKKCKTIINNKKIKKKDIKIDNNESISSSLDLSLNDNFDEQEIYIKNFHKTNKK